MSRKRAKGEKPSRKVIRLEKRLAALSREEDRRRRQLDAVHARVETVRARLALEAALTAAAGDGVSPADGIEIVVVETPREALADAVDAAGLVGPKADSPAAIRRARRVRLTAGDGAPAPRPRRHGPAPEIGSGD